MELRHIDTANLSVSAANMRGKGKPDIANILASVRSREILVPLTVRAHGSPDTFEIVAGQRRFHAALAVAQQNGGEADPLPCTVLHDAVLDVMTSYIASRQVANADAKAKRQIIADCLAGTNGRTKAEHFVPRWMTFPPSAYTQPGGVATVSRTAAVERQFRPSAANAAAPEQDSCAEVAGTPESMADAA